MLSLLIVNAADLESQSIKYYTGKQISPVISEGGTVWCVPVYQLRESLGAEMLALNLDSEGRIVFVNSRFETEMLYDGSQLIGPR
jgi:hypothetical protein